MKGKNVIEKVAQATHLNAIQNQWIVVKNKYFVNSHDLL